MGRKLTEEQKQEKKKLKRLIFKIRRTKRYLRWKDKILRRDVESYPKIPKGVQVHHKTEISKLIFEYEIKCVRDALDCKFLWDIDLGITLKRGEHFIWTKLSRYKYLTKGFRSILQNWMLYDTKIDSLNANKKRRGNRKR
jgi:hypothetical protein